MTHLISSMILLLVLECCYCAPPEMSPKYNKIEKLPKTNVNNGRVNPAEGAQLVDGYYYYSPGWSQETISMQNSINLHNPRDSAMQNAALGLDGRMNWARNWDPLLMYPNNYRGYFRDDARIPV